MDPIGLNRIHWIGGSPCAGKSTITRALAKQYGLREYHCDDHYGEHKEKADKTEQPTFHRMSRATWEELFMAPVSGQIEEEFVFYLEGFSWVLEDLRLMTAQEGPDIIAEGTSLTPRAVHGLGIRPEKAVWVVPSREFQLVEYAKREFIHGILKDCSDPERAYANWMARDIGFASRVAAEAEELGYRVVVTDGSIPIDVMTLDIAAHFGLTM